jgi:hypothetical protein
MRRELSFILMLIENCMMNNNGMQFESGRRNVYFGRFSDVLMSVGMKQQQT